MDQETALAYLGGELDPGEGTAVAAHLAGCAACRATVEGLSDLIGGARERLLDLDEPRLEQDPPPTDDFLRSAAKASLRIGPREAEEADADRSPVPSDGDPVRSLGRRPVRVAAAAGLITGIALVSWLAWQRTPTVSAAQLLRNAETAERTTLAAPNVIVHRVVDIEERRLPQRSLVSTRRVEIWQDSSRGIKARRLVNEKRQALAGEWTGASGVVTLYRPGLPPERSARAPGLAAEELWRWEPSVADFTRLAGRAEGATAEQRSDTYLLTAAAPKAFVAAGLLEVSITLTRDLRPVEQRLVIRRLEGGVYEYRFAEASLDRVPTAQVATSVFEPEPALMGPREPIRSAASPPAPLRLTVLQLDQLELEASYRLHGLARCATGNPTLRRGPKSLRVEVQLRNAACESEARRAFERLQSAPGVSLKIASAEGDPQPPTPSPPGALLIARLPAYAALREQFAPHVAAVARRRPDGESADAILARVIREYAASTLARSNGVLAGARSLDALTTRWTPQALRPLDLDSVAKWQTMLRDHARALQQDCETLRALLEPAIVPLGNSEPSGAERPLQDVSEVAPLVTRLVALSEDQHRLVSRLFAERGGEPPRVEELQGLGETLRRIEKLAALFAEPWPLERRQERIQEEMR